ncbi:uncharacterized protein LOC18011653 [Eutrema salsugineum]|uniref:uncharacterized protein LOC18011653 n=1 Tax=Eutrema salsugineum TaxID=72664 RepID=UPI000CED47FD|nr:uncharacterized protein LOC18011653 [Eutrema salsugineum]
MSSSTNLNAKSGNDPLAHQGEESSANPQDQNKSNTANSEEDSLNQTKNKAEEDCGVWRVLGTSDYYGLYLGEKKAALTRELDMLEEAEAAAAKKKESEELKGK